MDVHGMRSFSSPREGDRYMAQYPPRRVPKQSAWGMDLPGHASSDWSSGRPSASRTQRRPRARLHIRRPCVLPGTARDLGGPTTQEIPMPGHVHRSGSQESGQVTSDSDISECKDKLEYDHICDIKSVQYPPHHQSNDTVNQSLNVTRMTAEATCTQSPFRRELFRTLMPRELSASSLVAERTFFTVNTLGGEDTYVTTEPVQISKTFTNGDLSNEKCEINMESKKKCVVNITEISKGTNNSNQTKDIVGNTSKVNSYRVLNSIIESKFVDDDTENNDFIKSSGAIKSSMNTEDQHISIISDVDHLKVNDTEICNSGISENKDQIYFKHFDLAKPSEFELSVEENKLSSTCESVRNTICDPVFNATSSSGTYDELDDDVLEDYHIPNFDQEINGKNLRHLYHRQLPDSSVSKVLNERLLSVCDSGLGEEDFYHSTPSRLSSCPSISDSTEIGRENRFAHHYDRDELLKQRENSTPISSATSGSSCSENPFKRELFRTLMPRKLSASSMVAERTFFTVDTIGGRNSHGNMEFNDRTETRGYMDVKETILGNCLPSENSDILCKSNKLNSTVNSKPVLDFESGKKNSSDIDEDDINLSEVDFSRTIKSITDIELPTVFKGNRKFRNQNAQFNDSKHLPDIRNENNVKTRFKQCCLITPLELEPFSEISEFDSLNLSEPGVYDLVEDCLASIYDSVSRMENNDQLSKEVMCFSSRISDSGDEVVEESLISICDMKSYEDNYDVSEVEMERMISSCDSGLGDSEHDHVTLSRESSCTPTFSTDEDMCLRNLDIGIEGVLCGNRVSQMTKTYNDIEAVTRLLQEKEKDLELAAKIGQQLLSRSKVLEERNAGLESELTSSNDLVTQIKHDLQMKSDLLQIYTNDVDDSSCETTPTGLRFINVDILQNRVKNLEAENASLRTETFQLVEETDEVEDREENLVKDVIKQLGDANSHANQLSEELSKKVEDSLRHQEEITQLLAQQVDLQSRNKHMRHENEELHNMVGVARECQQELTTELAELKEKYAEVLDLLHDTQEQLRRVQKKNLPGRQGSHLSNNIYSSPFNSGNDSIATELHSLNSIGEELSNTNEAVKNHNMRRAFETVRLTGKYNSGSHGSLSSLGYGSSVISTPTHVPSAMGTPTHMTNSMSQSYTSAYLGSRGSSLYSGESGHPSLDSGADSDASMHTDSEDNYPASRAGVPGWPGTPDLNSCLRRLGPGERSSTPSHYLPYGCRTPDSIMSTDQKNPWPTSPVLSPGSGKSGGSNISSGFGGSDQWRLPQKLQIVKPIEGSLTLHQWSRLATPHLGGLLEEREGVANKGGIGHNLNLEVYSMSDVEEDEEDMLPGKQFMSTSGINTYTNCTILHPDDSTMLTPSYTKTQVSVLPTCSGLTGTTPSTPMRQPSCPSSRRGSTATFSTNVGLAKVLNERGMSQAPGWTPTATPVNSPAGSRPGSPEPEGYKLPGLDDLTKTFQYGASLLRRTFYKEEVSSGPHSPVGPQVNLLETVQDLGVERLMRPQEMTLSVGGVVTSRPATSPLLHLSNLIMSNARNTSTTTSTTTSLTCTGITTTTNVRGAGCLVYTPKLLSSPGERRPSFPPGAPMGIPGHPGAGHLDTRLSQLKPGQRYDLGTVKPGQRSDLGTVGGRQRPTSLGTVPGRGRGADGNVGAVTWMAHGRKGGLY